MDLDAKLLRTVLSRFNRNAFETFAYTLCAANSDKYENPGWLPEAGDGVFYAGDKDSYGGSLHHVWVSHFLPTELFSKAEAFQCNDPVLFDRLRAVQRIYNGQIGYWGMVSPHLRRARKLRNIAVVTNIVDHPPEVYQRHFIPRYGRVIRRTGLRIQHQVGSYDSFVDLNEIGTRDALRSFLLHSAEGLSINLNPEGVPVSPFFAESPIGSCKSEKILSPCEPVYITTTSLPVLKEFESLLKPSVSEAKLEQFLKQHFQDIFGFEYDRIETQVWINFPRLDVAHKNRRLDIFLRNSVHNDWELFELKRIVRLTGSHRDIPILAAEVSRSVQQIRYYARLLAKDSVKEHFAKRGIEYFQPSLHLVIGRKPQIDHAHWGAG